MSSHIVPLAYYGGTDKMAYKIRFNSYSGTGRTTTQQSYPTKSAAQAHAKKMNKHNPGINARIVKNQKR